MNDLLQRARAVKLAIFDVDGVLTDGRLMVFSFMEWLRHG